jgi:hypothetical protein
MMIDSSHELIAPDMDLVYSPDDDAETGKGYYFHRYKPRDETSQLFESRAVAIFALHAKKIRWTA